MVVFSFLQVDALKSALGELKVRKQQRMEQQAAASKAKAKALVATLDGVEDDIEEGKARTAKEECLIKAHGMSWRRFVKACAHAQEGRYWEVDGEHGPTLKQVQKYGSYIFRTRKNYSTVGRVGVGSSYKHQVMLT